MNPKPGFTLRSLDVLPSGGGKKINFLLCFKRQGKNDEHWELSEINTTAVGMMWSETASLTGELSFLNIAGKHHLLYAVHKG